MSNVIQFRKPSNDGLDESHLEDIAELAKTTDQAIAIIDLGDGVLRFEIVDRAKAKVDYPSGNVVMVVAAPRPAAEITEDSAPYGLPSRVQAAEEPIRANAVMVRQFLRIISTQAARAIGDSERPGYLQLSRLHPTGGEMVPQRFRIDDIDGMVKSALGDAEAGHNCYIEGRTVSKELKGKARGKAEDTEFVFAFQVDDDADKGMAAKVLAEPSLVVKSSASNRHFWYFLDKAIPASQAKEIGKAIKKAAGGDHCSGNIVQPFRVAGTPNFPTAKKIAAGRFVAPTRVLAFSGKLYSAAELLEAFQPAAVGAKGDSDTDSERDDFGSDFNNKQWVKEDLLPADLLKMIIEGVQGEEEDRSTKFFAVVASLKRRYWSLDAIVELFEKYPAGIAVKYTGRIREETTRVYGKVKVPFRPELPVIGIVKGNQTEIVTQIEDALAKAGVPIFERSDEMVYPNYEEFDAGEDRKVMVAGLSRFTPDTLRHEIDRSANFISWKKDKSTGTLIPVPTDLPKDFTNLVLSNKRYWKHKPVSGIITTPLLRPDGSLICGDKAHYDPATRLYYVPGLSVPPIPDKPSEDDAKSSLNLLTDLLDEFPFIDVDAKTGGAVSMSVALSALLTPIARAAMDTAPMHLFAARAAGSGKSYIVEIASTIATGDICAVAAQASTSEETEKRLSSLIIRGAPIISLDNADRDIEDLPLLCQMLTQGRVSLRILGRSEQPEFECRSSLFATGNNVSVVGDLTRRTLVGNLDPGVERPEMREFKRNPVEIVKANRGTYVAACLTIIKAYLAAGAPAVYAPLASYGQWSRMVRGPLIWLGQSDPVASMEQARRDDPELGAIRQLLTTGWLDVGKFYRVRDVVELSKTNDELAELLDRIAGNRGGNLSPERVGAWFRKISGRVVDGLSVRPESS